MEKLFESSPTAAWINLSIAFILFAVGVISLLMGIIGSILHGSGRNKSLIARKWTTLMSTGAIGTLGSQFFAQFPFASLKQVWLLLQFILILNIVVFIHEMGHYIAARAFKLPISEFSVGFGNKIYGFTHRGTEFNLRALPIGGFVKHTDEDHNKLNLIQRIIFYLAGIILNLISFCVLTGVISQNFVQGFYKAAIKIPSALTLIFTNIHLADIYGPDKDIVNRWGEYASISQMIANPLEVFSILSVLLAISNLIPVPVLDGGRVVLALLEKLFLLIGFPKTWIEKGTKALMTIGFLVVISPTVINTLWAAGVQIKLNLVETLLWSGLLFTLFGNVIIFIKNRRQRLDHTQ